MPPRLPIGISQFPQLREQGSYYVDKTAFISEVLSDGDQAFLFPRPTTFGKAPNLSALRSFLAPSTPHGSPCSNTSPSETDTEARRHFQRYPLIHLTFKDATGRSWHEMAPRIRTLLANDLGRHAPALSEHGPMVHDGRS